MRIAEMGNVEKKVFPTKCRPLVDSVMESASGVRLARIIRRQTMVYAIENQMVVDAAWDWNESMSPDKKRLKRERQAYEEAEREDREDEYII